jgi:hypothetical protein
MFVKIQIYSGPIWRCCLFAYYGKGRGFGFRIVQSVISVHEYVCLCISGVSAINPLAAFYDIHGRNVRGAILLFCPGYNTIQDEILSQTLNYQDSNQVIKYSLDHCWVNRE